MSALAIVYWIQSVLYFIVISSPITGKKIKNNKIYYILLLIATCIGYIILEYSLKTYVVIGFMLAAIIAYVYSLVTINEDVAKEFNLSFGNALFVCIVSIFLGHKFYLWM